MARVGIKSDEWYPVFSVDRDPRYPNLVEGVADVDDETLTRWDRVFAEFEAVQDELQALADKSRQTA